MAAIARRIACAGAAFALAISLPLPVGSAASQPPPAVNTMIEACTQGDVILIAARGSHEGVEPPSVLRQK